MHMKILYSKTLECDKLIWGPFCLVANYTDQQKLKGFRKACAQYQID